LLITLKHGVMSKYLPFNDATRQEPPPPSYEVATSESKFAYTALTNAPQPPVVFIAPPEQQTMSDHLFSQNPGILIRQKLRIQNVWVCCQMNKFQIGSFPHGLDPSHAWEDDVFAQQGGLMYAEEESTCLCKTCCGDFREFDLKVYAGHEHGRGPELLRLHRPFRCPCFPCCCPQEITVTDVQRSKEIGKVVQDFRCLQYFCCASSFWSLQGSDGLQHHVLSRNLCCNSNMCAPTCCCPTSRLDIWDGHETIVEGSLENLFPGCSCRTLCCSSLIDNYRLRFPPASTPNQRATMFAAAILIDYQIFGNMNRRREFE
jgi:hypothetical protein